MSSVIKNGIFIVKKVKQPVLDSFYKIPIRLPKKAEGSEVKYNQRFAR